MTRWVRLFFNIWPFGTTIICPMAIFWQSKFKILPNTLWRLWKIAKDIYFLLPKMAKLRQMWSRWFLCSTCTLNLCLSVSLSLSQSNSLCFLLILFSSNDSVREIHGASDNWSAKQWQFLSPYFYLKISEESFIYSPSSFSSFSRFVTTAPAARHSPKPFEHCNSRDLQKPL